MNIYQGKPFLYFALVLSAQLLISGCDQTQETKSTSNSLSQAELQYVSSNVSAIYPEPSEEDYEIVVKFNTSGILHINDQQIALGDPLESWISVLGNESRITRNRGFIWDHLGISLSIDETATDVEIVDQFSIYFSDYYQEWPEKKDRYPDGPPHGVFKGLFKFADAWIDRDRKVSEFLEYNSTSTLKDSFDRSLVFRDIFVNVDGKKVSFSITQGLSKEFPEGPNNITVSIIR